MSRKRRFFSRMALNFLRNRRRRLSMTSLIDVIFLLLLFFMLTSTFSKFAEIEFATATAGRVEADRALRFIKLDVNRILVDGLPVPLNTVASLLRSDVPQTALISLGPDATSQQLIDLLTRLAPVRQLQTQVVD